MPTQTIIVRASSVSAPTLYGEARVRIGSVQVSPPTVSLQANQQKQFTAMIPAQFGEQRVTWTVNGFVGGDARVGTITDTGLYTAPAVLILDPIIIRATSVAAPSLYGEARVTLGSIRITPTSAVVSPGSNFTFQAILMVGGTNQQIKWFVNGIENGNETVGGIGGGSYFAPRVVPNTPIVVRATSAAVPTLFAEAQVTVGIITVNPPFIYSAGGGSRQFTATVNANIADQHIRWLVDGVEGGNNVSGTITRDGLYYPPLTPGVQSVSVQAASLAVPELKGFATVTFVGSVRVTPTTATVIPGQSVQFTAQVTPFADQVNWSINGSPGGNDTVGRISSAGLYVAPNVVPAGPITVRATSVNVPSIFGEAQVMFSVSGVSVVVTPSPGVLNPNQTQQFTATVLPPSTSQQVTWTVNGVPGGNATFGTITATGFYTAPATIPANPVVTVRATSVAVPTAFGEVQFTIQDAGQSRPKK